MGVSPMGRGRCPPLVCDPLAGPAQRSARHPLPLHREEPFRKRRQRPQGAVHREDPGVSAEEVRRFDLEGEVGDDAP